MDTGFQDLHPEAFLISAEILGNIWAANLPFNVQNALGNWLMLIGQILLTFNAQQQYFQGGPGRYYNASRRDETNPFRNRTTPAGQASGESQQEETQQALAEIQETLALLQKQLQQIHLHQKEACPPL